MLRNDLLSTSLDEWSTAWDDITLSNTIDSLSPEEINQILALRTSFGEAPLHWAAKNKNIKMAESLLRHEKSINQTGGPLNQTALHYAAHNDDANMIELLLRSNADCRTQDDQNNMPIHLAAIMDNSEALSRLIEHDRTLLSETGVHNRTLFIIAANNQNINAINTLLDYKDDINQVDLASGHSALHIACTMRTTTLLDFLLNKGASPDNHSQSGITPLQLCAKQGGKCLAAARLLIEHGANVNQGNPSPLATLKRFHNESAPGVKEFMDLLKQHGATLDTAKPTEPGQRI